MQKEKVIIMRTLTLTFALLILYIGALGQSNSNRIQNDSDYIEIDGSKLKFVAKGVGDALYCNWIVNLLPENFFAKPS